MRCVHRYCFFFPISNIKNIGSPLKSLSGFSFCSIESSRRHCEVVLLLLSCYNSILQHSLIYSLFYGGKHSNHSARRSTNPHISCRWSLLALKGALVGKGRGNCRDHPKPPAEEREHRQRCPHRPQRRSARRLSQNNPQRCVLCPFVAVVDSLERREDGLGMDAGKRVRMLISSYSLGSPLKMSSKLPASLAATDEEIQMLLAAQSHIGSKNCDKQMLPYVWKRRSDGAPQSLP